MNISTVAMAALGATWPAVGAEVGLVVTLDADRTDAVVGRRLDWAAVGLQPGTVRVEENGGALDAAVVPVR